MAEAKKVSRKTTAKAAPDTTGKKTAAKTASAKTTAASGRKVTRVDAAKKPSGKTASAKTAAAETAVKTEASSQLTGLMSSVLSNNSLNSVSGKTGLDTGSVAGILASALPALLNGANGQASASSTSDSFYQAVSNHAGKDPESVDMDEGSKIIDHLLGDRKAGIANEISRKTGVSAREVCLVLSAAAPILMNLLGKTTSGAGNSSGVASMLGSLLGGSSNSSASGSLLTSALSSVLSGAASNSSSGNSLLGSMLNGSPSSGGSLLGSLLGGSSYSNNNNSSPIAGLAGSLLGSFLGGNNGNSNSHSQKPSSGGIDLGGILSSLLK